MELKGFMPFWKGISRKVNGVAWLEFELANLETAVQHINHNATRTSPQGV